jgi:phage shock protein C
VKFKNKKLRRSKKNKILTGTLGGIGEMLGVDPTIARIAWLIFTPLVGFVPGIVIYLAASVIIPKSK